MSQAEEVLNKIENITPSMEQYTGRTLNFEHYNGYIPVANNENTSLFFSMITKQGETLDNMSNDTPVIFWFAGGPGCSGQNAIYGELGPYKLQNKNLTTGKFTILKNEYSWNKQALLVFTDQPLNTGLSYGPKYKSTTTEQASEIIKNFLKKFYQKFQNLRHNPTYFFGQSYAGHYIPKFASMILNENPVEGLNFQGVGIGDGLFNANVQMNSYADYSYNIAIAGHEKRQQTIKLQNQGIQYIKDGEYYQSSAILDELSGGTLYGNVAAYNIHYYNYYGQGEPNFGYDIIRLMNDKQFRQIYQIPSIIPRYQACSDQVYQNFQGDITLNFQRHVEELLEDGIKVLLYNGQLDLICNAPGQQDWINTLKWENFENWYQSEKKVWYDKVKKRKVLGNYQAYSNFVLANVYQAGHVVPVDQPQASEDMLQKYLAWDW